MAPPRLTASCDLNSAFSCFNRAISSWTRALAVAGACAALGAVLYVPLLRHGTVPVGIRSTKLGILSF